MWKVCLPVSQQFNQTGLYAFAHFLYHLVSAARQRVVFTKSKSVNGVVRRRDSTRNSSVETSLEPAAVGSVWLETVCVHLCAVLADDRARETADGVQCQEVHGPHSCLRSNLHHTIVHGNHRVTELLFLQHNYPTSYSVAKSVGCFQRRLSVCLCVCLSTR